MQYNSVCCCQSKLMAVILFSIFYGSNCLGIERVNVMGKKPYTTAEISGVVTRADNEIQIRRIKKMESAEKISIDEFFSQVKNLRKKSETGNDK